MSRGIASGTARQKTAKVLVAAIILMELVVFGRAHLVSAHGPTHTNAWTPGEMGDQANNLGHIWFQVYSPNAGSVTSGGQFHDNPCSPLCVPVLGGQTALDIGAPGNQASLLWVFPAGNGANAHNPPHPAADMYVYVWANPVGNFRTGTPNGTRPACDWRHLSVWVSYQDIYAQWQWSWVGNISVAHNTNWTLYQPNNTWIYPNATTPSPWGSGNVHWPAGITIGQVYNGGDIYSLAQGGCSSGAHTHIEFYSSHEMGAYYEWHAAAGPDSYNYYPYSPPGPHVHQGWDYGLPQANDPIGYAYTVGWLGGSSALYWMLDNPYFGNH